MARIDSLLQRVVDSGSSDVHLATGSCPIVRRFGQLKRLEMAALTDQVVKALLHEILTPAQWADFEKNLDIDFAYDLPGKARFRCNALVQRKGIDICFRIIRPVIPSFEELGLPSVLKKACDNHQGLILVTGAAGSGKTTTLAAMVDLINTHRSHHVLSIEDPIEYVHPVKKGVVNQRQLGTHTLSAANALKAALREDPDVIVVGDLRDLETITLAISASETGHLVIGSMNTTGAGKTVDRIIDSYPPSQQNQIRAMLGESLKAVISQRLLQRADGAGSVLAYEFLLGSRQLANLIKDAKTVQIPNLMQTGKTSGMRTMEESVQELLKAGSITPEVAARASNAKQTFGQEAPAAAAPAPVPTGLPPAPTPAPGGLAGAAAKAMSMGKAAVSLAQSAQARPGLAPLKKPEPGKGGS
jgi:twitching motility protein PilT